MKRGAKGLGVSLSPPGAGTLPYSLHLASLGRHGLTPRGWIFLLFSK